MERCLADEDASPKVLCASPPPPHSSFWKKKKCRSRSDDPTRHIPCTISVSLIIAGDILAYIQYFVETYFCLIGFLDWWGIRLSMAGGIERRDPRSFYSFRFVRPWLCLLWIVR